MAFTEVLAIELWYKALAAEIGIAIEVEKKEKAVFRNILYSARQGKGDPELEKVIMIFPGPKPNEIWLCRKDVELDE